MSTYRWTGVAEPAVSLAYWQQRMGCETWVGGILGRSFEEVASSRGVRLAREIPLSLDYSPRTQWQLLLKLREFCLTRRIDIIHTHLPHDHWVAAIAMRGIRQRRPLVIRTYHRYERLRRDLFHQWLFSKATAAVITVSSPQRELLRQAYRGVPIELIFGGVDPDRFCFNPEGRRRVRADMGEKPDAMVAGLVAHLGYNRGIQWLLAAAPSALDAVPNAVIWIVGQGELRDFLRQELRKPRYRRRVVLAGYRTDDLPDTYSAMDAGLLLGLGSEGSARAALETMATSRPVIAVRKGALIDTITHGVDGLLVEENDVDGLSRALIEVLGQPQRAAQMGEAARKKIVSQFTERHRAERTLQLYRKLLSADHADG
jgi:glycosyltransferase involved in cell wall biosynthesis